MSNINEAHNINVLKMHNRLSRLTKEMQLFKSGTLTPDLKSHSFSFKVLFFEAALLAWKRVLVDQRK